MFFYDCCSPSSSSRRKVNPEEGSIVHDNNSDTTKPKIIWTAKDSEQDDGEEIHNRTHLIQNQGIGHLDASIVINSPDRYPKSTLRSTLVKSIADFKRFFQASHQATPPTSPESLQICIVTWNLNGKIPKSDLGMLLPSREDPHVLVLGVQECSSLNEWERLVRDYTRDTHTHLRSEGTSTMSVILFISKNHPISPDGGSNLETHSSRIFTANLAGRVAGTKGAVGIAVRIGMASFCFVNAHFAAHQDRVVQRNADYRRVDLEKWGMVGFDDDDNDKARLSDRYDHIFWFGDLNYRVNGSQSVVGRLIRDGRLEVLLNNDQLYQEMRCARCFQGFWEAEIGFAPTFKFDTNMATPTLSAPAAGLGGYDLVKMRIPSWTDRILYRSRQHTDKEGEGDCNMFLGQRIGNSEIRNGPRKSGNVCSLEYRSVPSYCDSDHKPVLGLYVVRDSRASEHHDKTHSLGI